MEDDQVVGLDNSKGKMRVQAYWTLLAIFLLNLPFLKDMFKILLVTFLLIKNLLFER